MSMTWLANVDRDTFWAHHAWSEFAAMPAKERTIILLPVHGFADHGLGLPLDAEESVGSAVIRRAMERVNGAFPCRVMPPLRFALAPYPANFFGIDAETAHDLLCELAAGVKATGFHKLVFFNTSPWNEELVDATARDVRVEQGLQTFVVNLSGLGLDFHPASERRAHTQAAVAHVLGQPPRPAARPADISDAAFRPGCYRQPAPLIPEGSTDAAALLETAGEHLARLLSEIRGRAPLVASERRGGSAPAQTPAPASPGPAPVFPRAFRNRYLPALTRDELDALPDKDKALVILPVGSIEQHGHHLPVGVDSILGQAWLENVLPRLTAGAPVYVAPPITYGKSNEHVGFAGTLSISGRLLRRLLLAAASQLKALGFNQLAVLNTHGGNSAVVIYSLREIQTAPGLRAGVLGWPYKPDLSPQEAEYGFHAGEWETALMLAIAPSLVTPSKAVCEYPARLTDPGELRPENAPATFSWATADISESGVMGDATAATTEKGRRWLDAASEALARRIETLLKE